MKKTLGILLATVAVFALAACGGGATPTPETIIKEVVVEKEVVRTVEIEKIVEKKVVTTVVVEKILVTTPTPAPVSDDPIFGGTLKVTSQSSIANLDPLYVAAFVTVHIASHNYESLFGLDETLNPQLQMAEKWNVSSDGLTYTMNLRDGLTFHNGKQVTTDDVLASFNRWLPSQRGKLWSRFASEVPATKIDDSTFEFNFDQTFGLVLPVLARPAGGVQIWPAPQASKPWNEPMDGWIGTGPYKFEDWEQGNRMIFTRFDSYNSRSEPGSFFAGGKKAYLDRIEWLEIPDEETKIAGIETGEWDIVDYAGLDFFQRLDSNPDIGVMISTPGNQSSITMQSNVFPTDNKLVRQAIGAAINAEDHMASLGDPALWMLCPAVFFCGTPLESDVSAEFYNENNPERAKELLAQAGYNGEPIVIMNPTDYPQLTPLGFVLKPQLEKAGFNVEMPTMDWASIVGKLREKDWNMFTNFCASWFCGDPLLHFIVSEGHYMGGNPDLVQLQLDFAMEQDAGKQMEIVEEIQRVWYDNQHFVILGQWFPIYPHRTYVRNFRPTFVPIYYNAWLVDK